MVGLDNSCDLNASWTAKPAEFVIGSDFKCDPCGAVQRDFPLEWTDGARERSI